MAKEILGALSEARVKTIREEYGKDEKAAVIRHALSRSSLSNVLYDSSALIGVDPAFSLEIKTLPVADQKVSGRCWIFAGLNVLREAIAKKNKIKSFELSQNYISLFDKIEKSNFALESIIKLAKNDHDERVFDFIVHEPVADGGQWDMFVNIVKKYGLLPKGAFPETFQSDNTREGNQLINAAIRLFAEQAHNLALKGEDKALRQLKEKTMDKIYGFLLSSFGVPPKTFDFEYVDEKEKFHVERGLTPHSFFEKYIGLSIDEYQSIINSPTADKPFGKNYTIDFLGNVVEGKPINHLNLEMGRIKELIVKQLTGGNVVWFGSDVGFFRDREGYAWDSKAFDFVSPFGFDVKFDKGGMLDFRHSAMNHAMVITGVDIVGGEPKKWKIENSWGEKNGIKGYYVMSAEFFDRFVYQAVILKKYLSAAELAATKADPKHLSPWDPMGTLAD